MTEVAIRHDVADYQDVAVRRLAEWAQSAEAAYQVATRLVESSFVPASFKGKPIEAAAAILAGLECGLQPMSSLRSFDVIQGQAAPRAITLRAIVQSYGHEVELVESTATRCRMRGRRKGSEGWQSVSWTVDRAKDLGLLTKDNWKKQPAAMLVARATSEICRLIAADAILGIGYSSEEVIDGAAGDPEQPPAAPEPAPANGSRRMSYRAPVEDVQAPVAEPAVPEPAPDAAPPDGRKITTAQSKMLHALLTKTGRGDRDTGLAFMSDVLRRQVDTSKSLTRDEASTVIDVLKTEADDTPAGEQPAESRDELWARLQRGAQKRGFTSDKQLADAIEAEYALPIDEVTDEQLTHFMTRLALGTVKASDQ